MRPLDGITVIALEHAVAAPFATRQLADQGARVIKIERPGVGDFARAYDERVRGMASYFVWLNRSKESLTLDLKQDGAQEVLQRLLERADVLVQNLVPGAAARLGLSEAALRPKHPSLILCDISGYGNDGPHRDRKAYDLLIQAEAGLLSVTGTPQTPARAGISAADIAAGMYGYTNVLTALLLRARTGRGSHIDVSMLESLAEWMGSPMYYTFEGAPPPARPAASHPSVYPYGPFVTGDGRSVVFAVQNEREWLNFCVEVMHQPGLANDARFTTNTLRTTHREELRAIIEDALRPLTLEQAGERLARANLGTATMNGVADLWNHPQLAARGRWRDVGSPRGTIPALLPPGSNSEYEPRLDAVPALGQHTTPILAELGFSREQIEQLRARRAVGAEQP